MLYRVIRRTAGSLQPGDTYWTRDVLYCGYDRAEALRVYHEHEPTDFGGGYGNRCQETLFEQLDTDALDEDEAGKMKRVEID